MNLTQLSTVDIVLSTKLKVFTDNFILFIYRTSDIKCYVNSVVYQVLSPLSWCPVKT